MGKSVTKSVSMVTVDTDNECIGWNGGEVFEPPLQFRASVHADAARVPTRRPWCPVISVTKSTPASKKTQDEPVPLCSMTFLARWARRKLISWPKKLGKPGNEADDAWILPTHPKLLSTEYCEDALVRVVTSYCPKMASEATSEHLIRSWRGGGAQPVCLYFGSLLYTMTKLTKISLVPSLAPPLQKEPGYEAN